MLGFNRVIERNPPRHGVGSSEAQEDQQLDVDAEALGALLLEEVGDVGARDEMDVDVLMLVAAALADLPDAMARGPA